MKITDLEDGTTVYEGTAEELAEYDCLTDKEPEVSINVDVAPIERPDFKKFWSQLTTCVRPNIEESRSERTGKCLIEQYYREAANNPHVGPCMISCPCRRCNYVSLGR